MHDFDFAVFVGRFQPIHIGHQHVIDEALKRAERLILLIGSADGARSIRNPFSYAERVAMLEEVYRHELDSGRILLRPIPDRLYNDQAWIAEAQRIVTETVLDVGNRGGVHLHGTNDFRIALAGYKKDGTSFYLKMFPDWHQIDIPSQFGTLSSGEIRKEYFRRVPRLTNFGLAPGVFRWLMDFALTDTFKDLVAEREYIDAYKASWEGTPYPPVFVTVDAVVVQSGKVLLIRRGAAPGRGQLALPGGFINQTEPLKTAVIRELKEETMISDGKGEIPPAMLASFIDEKATRVFDQPDRSLRGRVITHAFLFRCPDRRTMFKVKGSDDAASAAWHRLGDLTPDQFFEDHWSILEEMVGL